MKEVIKVSISGISFSLDQRAYEVLSSYLEKLSDGYSNNPDGKEIIEDIQARIVEIILSKQTTDQIIEPSLVDSIIEQMGLPDQIATEQEPDKTQTPQTPQTEHFPRRLYRNSDGAKLGGVCSGIATFTDIDPVWIRLTIFAPIFLLITTAPLGFDHLSGMLGTLFGAIFLLYFVLWIAIPIAKTPRQKLEMRGEKITASSIHNNFRTEAKARSTTSTSDRSASILAELIYIIGRVIIFGIKAVAVVIGLFVSLTAVALIICYFTAAFGSDNIAVETNNLLSSLQGISPRLALTLAALFLLLPIALIMLLILRLLFSIKINRIAIWSIFGLWLIIFIYICVISIKNTNNIRQIFTHNHNIEFVDWDDQHPNCSDKDVNLNTISATIVNNAMINGDSTESDTVQIVVSKGTKN